MERKKLQKNKKDKEDVAFTLNKDNMELVESCKDYVL